MVKDKTALISVYDKEGVVDFAKSLAQNGWQIISTGGTYNLLKQSGLEVKSVEELTGYPEILDGRVKSMHPVIQGGILARRNDPDDLKQLLDLSIDTIDMVVCNLYPFEEVLKSGERDDSTLVENIDIGGPSMLRAAAKNFSDVLVVCDKGDYEEVTQALKEDQINLPMRRRYAAKAFRATAYYDSVIAGYFTEEKFPEKLVTGYTFSQKLRYGENPHQEASYYQNELNPDYQLKKLHGKQLSYNNYNDLKAAMDLVKEFEQPACVAVKHMKPCGVGIGENIFEAYQKAYQADDVSIFGGIVAFNRQVDSKTAQLLNEIFLEIVIAPSFTDEALEVLTQKKNIRLIEVANFKFNGKPVTMRQTYGGVLVQDEDQALYDNWQLKTSRQLSNREKTDLEFAWKVVKHVQSNGMVIAKDGQTLSIGNGEVRRVWALENALKRSSSDLEGAVVASDGFFFPDTIDLLKQYGIKAIVQPGGSKEDPNVIQAAQENDISVIFTGMRHFKH